MLLRKKLNYWPINTTTNYNVNFKNFVWQYNTKLVYAKNYYCVGQIISTYKYYNLFTQPQLLFNIKLDYFWLYRRFKYFLVQIYKYGIRGLPNLIKYTQVIKYI